MKSRVLALLFLSCAALFGQYKTALPGYRYEFPRDYFNHPDYATEWWYYTGNLEDSHGRRFGFELTFFRQGVDRQHQQTTPWVVRDVFLAHLAISDLNGAHFYHEERVNRTGPGLAGVDAASGQVWNGNWQADIRGSTQHLRAFGADGSVDLEVVSTKPPVIHGQLGISTKSAAEGQASHYFSLTRLNTSGKLTAGGEAFQVTGTSWMDHEFFTSTADPTLVGWDWLSVQLNDRSEIMLYRMRNKGGTVGAYSSGTFIAPDGTSTYLPLSDFSMPPAGQRWSSKATQADYPVSWHVSIPRLSIELDVTTPLASQELASKTELSPSYWEGAIDAKGTKNGTPYSGVGYLEMTGYARALALSH